MEPAIYQTILRWPIALKVEALESDRHSISCRFLKMLSGELARSTLEINRSIIYHILVIKCDNFLINCDTSSINFAISIFRYGTLCLLSMLRLPRLDCCTSSISNEKCQHVSVVRRGWEGRLVTGKGRTRILTDKHSCTVS